jgi:hypothetical protein
MIGPETAGRPDSCPMKGQWDKLPDGKVHLVIKRSVRVIHCSYTRYCRRSVFAPISQSQRNLHCPLQPISFSIKVSGFSLYRIGILPLLLQLTYIFASLQWQILTWPSLSRKLFNVSRTVVSSPHVPLFPRKFFRKIYRCVSSSLGRPHSYAELGIQIPWRCPDCPRGTKGHRVHLPRK